MKQQQKFEIIQDYVRTIKIKHITVIYTWELNIYAF